MYMNQVFKNSGKFVRYTSRLCNYYFHWNQLVQVAFWYKRIPILWSTTFFRQLLIKKTNLAQETCQI